MNFCLKEELFEVVYWARQIVALLLGFLFGVFNLTGFFPFIGFFPCFLNASFIPLKDSP